MNHDYRWLPSLGKAGFFLVPAMLVLLLAGCSSSSKSEQELRQELQSLKGEVASFKEKLAKLEAGQQEILALLKKPAAAPEPVPPPATGPPSMAWPGPSPAVQPLSVSQLLADKNKYLGTRVTVRGMVGPVMVHHKSLLLKSPQGMVEVLLAKLPDPKQIQRLTSVQLDQPLTVTGMVNLPPPKGGGAAQLQIDAEAVDF